MDSSKAFDNKEYTQLNSVIELVQRYGKEEFSNLDSFLAIDCIKYSKDKTRIYKEHDIDNIDRFNFFESISDKWYRENFHSDVLYTILNPNTKEIGRKDFLQEFVKFLEIEDRFDCNKNCEVIKECSTGFISWKDNNGNETGQEGYIDLLIKNDTQAIIIENKINYAHDMKNQLVRYMKYVEEKLGIKKYTVVYLTLIGDKEPPLGSYAKDFEDYKIKLQDEKILKKVCAVNENNGLANIFLNSCYIRLEEEMTNTHDPELKKKCNIASVYIDQYKTLLEHLGGRAYMLSTEQKLIEEIYSNKEKYKAATDFVNLWCQKRDEALKKILIDKIQNKHPKIALNQTTVHGYNIYTFEMGKEDCFAYLYGSDQLGFTSREGEKFSEQRQCQLFGIIDKIQYASHKQKNAEWVWCTINKDSQTFIDDVINALEILFNA